MARFNERARVFGVVAVLAAVFIILFARSLQLMFGENAERATLFVMAREPQSIRKLASHAEDLRALASDIDSASLGEIRATTERTVVLVDRANAEFAAQMDAWERTRGRMREDESAYLSLRNRIDETRKLQEEEIVRLQRALDGANSLKDRIATAVATFIMGVLGSLVAAAIFPALSMRALRKLLHARRRTQGP